MSEALMRIEAHGQAWWDQFYLGMAKYASTASKDPSTQTGAVIVDASNRPMSWGCNGFPQRIADDARLHDRLTKYEMIVHCEINALIFAKCNIIGYTIYVWPFMMCSRCASVMIQAGIWRHVTPDNPDPRWAKSFELSTRLLPEADVDLALYEPTSIGVARS